jgi:hypothetical protein
MTQFSRNIALSATLTFCVFSCYASNVKTLKKINNANPNICELFAKALQREHAGASELYVNFIEGDGRDSVYQDVDIDEDGTSDKVLQSCGSQNEGSCTLYVKLSTGSEYEMTENFFKVNRFLSKYYIVVGDTFPNRNTHRRLYLLSARGAELTCKSF